MIHFEIPKNQSSIIKVIGVGGGGGNAVNYMFNQGIEGVDFMVCNTDSQALALSPVPNKIQLGPALTQGLGAGANPEIGKQASEESLEDIAKILKVNTRMAFITAGMGGGTGTGGAPVVAKVCRDLGILTVGIVTTPFTYEGRKRMKQAQEGVERMREHVDTILIISNDKLRQQFGNLPFTKAFAMADDILATAARCITDVINTTGQINVDFADVCTVMKSGGVAILGNAEVSGENRALHAVEQALNSPLLNDSDIKGAQWILLNITSQAGEFEHTMDEAEAIQAYVQQQAGDNCDVILGMGHDPNLEDRIAVTVIATGFHHKEIVAEMPVHVNEPKKIVVSLGEAGAEAKTLASDNLHQSVSEPVGPVLIEQQERAQSLFPEVTTTASNVQSESRPERFELRGIAREEEFTPPTDSNENSDAPEEFKLVIREDKPAEIPMAIKIGDHVLTADEIESRRQFEEQKRALEERAERLRRMSFGIKPGEGDAGMDEIPAYVRRNMELDNSVASSEVFYSGYSVGYDGEGNKEGDQASIQTINTFLHGKKPD